MEGSEGELLSTWLIKSFTIPNVITINAVFAFQSYTSSYVKLKLCDAAEVNFSAWLEWQYFVEFNTSGEDGTLVMPVKTKPDVQPVMHHSPKCISREQWV